MVSDVSIRSHEHRHTDPSAGQWAPIVGTGLAVVGSLYMFSARALADPEKADSSSQENCDDTDSASRVSTHSDNTRQTVGQLPTAGSLPQRPSLSGTNTSDRDIGNRRKVAKMLSSIANYMGTAGHGQFDDSNFRREANSYPQVPGEVQRNTRLSQTEQRYNRSSDQLSRTGTSESHFEMSSPFSRPPSLLRIRSDSDPRPPDELTNASTAAPAAQPEMTQRPRRDTLEVPSPAHVPVRAVLERSRRSTNDSG